MNTCLKCASLAGDEGGWVLALWIGGNLAFLIFLLVVMGFLIRSTRRDDHRCYFGCGRTYSHRDHPDTCPHCGHKTPPPRRAA